MADVKFGRTLIAGGTGMLAKASARVASISGTTILAARNPLRRAKYFPRNPPSLTWMNATHGRRWLSDAEISNAVILAVQNQKLATSIAGTFDN